MVALAAAVVWTIVSRRLEYRRLFGWVHLFLRYYVAIIMLIYGAFKVVDTQFPPPTLEALSQPVGALTPMGLLWTFMGYSVPYATFGGLGEVVGAVLLLLAVLAGVPELAVPAAIVGGIGGLLWWQNTTDNWESWAYAWTLIPGFVGVGIILSGLLGRRMRESLIGGGWLILISLILFLVFGSFLGGMDLLGAYWLLLLIGLGVLLLVGPRSSLRQRV